MSTHSPKRHAAPNPFASLSFVAVRDGKKLPKPEKGQWPRCFWHVQSSGDYGADCIIGEELALEYINFAALNTSCPSILGWIVSDMPRELTGVEIGFLDIVACCIPAGAPRAKQVFGFYESHRQSVLTDLSAAIVTKSKKRAA